MPADQQKKWSYRNFIKKFLIARDSIKNQGNLSNLERK
jgi:hypothetical protein